MLTDKEAGELLQVSRITLWRERKAGRLSYRRVSGQIRYTSDDLESYLKNIKQEARAFA